MRTDELQGREFDWFATDKHGRFGMFSTGGEGPIPADVLRTFAQHDAASETIDTPNAGSEFVWLDFGGAGLFVYDWDGRLYKRVAMPTVTPPEWLLVHLRRIDVVPSLDCSFEEAGEVDLRFDGGT